MVCSSLGSCACLKVLRRLCSRLRSGGFLGFRGGQWHLVCCSSISVLLRSEHGSCACLPVLRCLCSWFVGFLGFWRGLRHLGWCSSFSVLLCKHISTAAALVSVDTSDRLFPESVAGTRNAVLFLFPGILVCGLVLGLRIKGMRLVWLTRRIRSGVPARFWDLLQFNFAPMIGATWVLATTTVGPRIACRAQATPRVDVDVARRCAPVVQVPGTHEHPAKTSGRFQVFVKGLMDTHW